MLDREKLLKFLNANLAVNQLSQAGKALSHVINEIEYGKFDAINDNQPKESIETALYELERLERNLELPDRGYVRNCFNGIVRTLKEGVEANA